MLVRPSQSNVCRLGLLLIFQVLEKAYMVQAGLVHWLAFPGFLQVNQCAAATFTSQDRPIIQKTHTESSTRHKQRIVNYRET